MPRPMFNDKLMTHQFHLLDVDFSMSLPPWVLLPSAGFSAITSPEISIETREVREGTDPFAVHVLDKASTNVLTLQRGVSAFNSDFWRWTVGCLMGNKPYDGNLLELLKDAATLSASPVQGKRRNLLLMHFTGMSVPGLIKSIGNASGAMNKIKGGKMMATGGVVNAAGSAIDFATNGLIDLGITSIPGKIYILFDCLPTRYKVGSDFDASSGEISLEELDIVYHRFEEMSLTT